MTDPLESAKAIIPERAARALTKAEAILFAFDLVIDNHLTVYDLLALRPNCVKRVDDLRRKLEEAAR